MKKIFLGCAVLCVLFTSCDYESKAYKTLKMQNDSIMAVQERQSTELDEYLSIIQEVDSGFETIRQSQNYMTVTSSTEGDLTSEMRSRVADNMYMINSILADNKAKIEELEKKLDNGNIKSTQLKKTVERLSATLEQKNAEITALQKELEQKDYKIDSLLLENQMINSQANDLAAENYAQQKTLQEQDAQIHRVYYLIANRKTIKSNNIDVKNMRSSLRTSLFTTADMRQLDRLDTNSKYAKILTKHPATSYELIKGSDKKYSLIIKNPTDFWSTSKYLLIQID